MAHGAYWIADKAMAGGQSTVSCDAQIASTSATGVGAMPTRWISCSAVTILLNGYRTGHNAPFKLTPAGHHLVEHVRECLRIHLIAPRR